MPTWLVHGFRWPRHAIRVHIILQNLEDCAPGWLMAPATVAELTSNLQTLFPEHMKHIPRLRFIEQYDPDDLSAADQPYAYVCDQVHDIRLGVDVDEVRSKGVAGDTWNALVELRNELAPGEKLGWFVVVNGDVERWAPPASDDGEVGEVGEVEEMGERVSGNGVGSQMSPTSPPSRVEDEEGDKKKGFKAWLGKVKKARSSKDLKNDTTPMPISPPLPPLPNSFQTLPTGMKKGNGKASL
ncbi:hypothetical protein P280DRAFT_499063 [Massarina eburnea CBS 473.64]|uniref:Uncharacterized protein n=1 Tax=Massarina eburnea CBS 473.64 TaxID=1395130 RepID=A0A6A6RZX8_9PLEO|nr:hypothetical protein P280DRAFT_499063 [Massarina eburnea CBS 473.64]